MNDHGHSSLDHRKSPVSLNIIIVGAGLSGLASAVSCSLSGHKVTIFESATVLQEVGAGLQITPNSSRLLRRWKLSEKFWDSVAEPTRLAVHRYSGQILALEEDFDKNIREKYGAPFVDAHRVDLQSALLERAQQLGAKLKLSQKVTNIDFDIPEITTQSGTKARADLIIAADGLWSRCRGAFLTTKDAPKPTGDLAYRVVLKLEDIKDPELIDWVRNSSCHFWIGPGAHAVGYSLRGGNMYNIVLLVPDDLPQGVSRLPGSVDQMKALFQGWDPILLRFLDLVTEVDRWKLMHHDEMEHWVSPQSNLVFVGDACHPMLPYLAQGANSAIEDGAVLGLLLGAVESRRDIPRMLKLYEQLRKSRGEAIVRETFKQHADTSFFAQRESFHMLDGPDQEKRDETFLSQLGKRELKAPFPSRWTCPEVQPWLYGYDAYQEVHDALVREHVNIPCATPEMTAFSYPVTEVDLDAYVLLEA
ncbi:FAD binding domain-containing protein [Fusarium flagelliforme]|uniref:FAD binding domain-containing protein n=1 Tax=Fusarium flagelliforme TaxID=2675880 RepID=A0A395M8L3_9HYPO|nr:FAD binding domain-containing protein [Fusarium flagelliforme]